MADQITRALNYAINDTSLVMASARVLYNHVYLRVGGRDNPDTLDSAVIFSSSGTNCM